jgi:Tol biopolymer transport system component
MPEPVAPPPVLSEAPQFGDATLVQELASDVEDENPTLTEDLLQIYFTSRREGGPGNADVWFAERASPDDPFGAPAPVPEVSTPEFDSSPAISPDGLTLWTAIDIDGGLGGLDIWVSTRATRSDPWSELVNVTELNSPQDDLPRPIGDNGRVMPIQSRRDNSKYQMYLAIRETPDGAFGTPLLLDSLLLEGQAMGDGFVTYDGLGVYFAYSAGGSGDLYFASRPSRDDDFQSAVPIDSLNTDADERDPWLSPDGQRLYFASDRDGVLNIYEARLETP